MDKGRFIDEKVREARLGLLAVVFARWEERPLPRILSRVWVPGNGRTRITEVVSLGMGLRCDG